MDYTSIKVGQLPTDEISGGNFIPHEVEGLLKKATINDLVAFIGATDAVGFRAVSVPNGGTLPTTNTQEFILVGPGTYNNVGGGSTITVTEELNALVSNGTFWFIGVQISIDAPPGNAVWGQIVGTLSNQTDLKALLDVKADLVAGKVPASQLPSYVDDVVEVANFAALPATGETGKIYVTLDSGFIYRWTGTIYVRIADEAPTWGTIVGTLSDQTDLQTALNAKEDDIAPGTTAQYWRGDKSWQTLNKSAVGLGNVDNTSDLNKPISTATQTALNGKFNNPTGDTTQYIAGDGSLITFPIAGQAGTLVREVRNVSGATITKGTVVYINGGNGNRPTIAKALATGDSTSAQTFGLVQSDISNNANGYVVCIGDLIGINTSGISVGSQLYLSSTNAGEYTTTKQLAPNHLVYIGIVTRSHASLGQIEVKIQNGYELDELHDVAIASKANNEVLVYESSSDLWKNKSIPTILGYTPANDSAVVKLTGNQTISGVKSFLNRVNVYTNNAVGLNVEGEGDSAIPVVFSRLNQDLITLQVFGSIQANKYIVRDGLSSQFLKADGSLDSNTYLTSLSGAVLTTTDQSVAGVKTFTNLSKFTNNTGSFAVEIDTTSSDALVVKNNGTTTLQISRSGEILGTKYRVSGGFASQFLKANGDLDSTAYTPASRTITINGVTQDLTANRSFTVATHDAVTIGTANGLSLSGQALSLALASGSTTGALSAADWTTFNNKQNTITNPITGSGTINFLPKFTQSGSIGNSQIFDNGTFIGIGISTGLNRILQVVGSTPISHKQTNSPLEMIIGQFDDSGNAIINNTANAILGFSTNNQRAMTILPNLNVGIGTTSPLEKLEVVTSAAYTTIYTGANGNGASGVASSSDNRANTWFAGSRRDSIGGSIGTDRFNILYNTNAILTATTGGNVGIGTTSPSAKLSVNGTLQVTGSVAPSSGTGLELFYDGTGAGTLAFSRGVGYIPNYMDGSQLQFFTSSSERMRITSGGALYLNTTSSVFSTAAQFELLYAGNLVFGMNMKTTFSDGVPINFVNSAGLRVGYIYQTNFTTSYITSSDYRLKQDLKPINGLDLVSKIKVYDYQWKEDETRAYGVLAHELQEVIPQAVNGEKDGEQMQGVDYSKLVPILVQAIQELNDKINKLENK